ncbi:hypothetical protein Tco_1327327 [Tanacetum coccineum]
MVAFLEKPAESDGFHEIIDFMNANQIHYALTFNPTIYTSCIEQFWATAKAKMVNGESQLQALVDKKKVIITETSIRSDLHLEDAGGIDCLPTATIFEELEKMGDFIADVPNEEFVPTHSNDPLHSSEDRLKLNELMDMCTKLTERVLDLEHTKIAQAQEIINLKLGRVHFSDDDSLGAQEDASNQGRSIEDIDKDVEVSLVDETQGRIDDAEMFDTYALFVSTVPPSTTVVPPPSPVITEVEITLAQTLAKLKSWQKILRLCYKEPGTELQPQ